MVGAVLPDLTKIDWFLDSYLIKNALGIPFNWGALHTFSGVLVLAGIGAVLFGRDQDHRHARGMLLAGALGHLLVDSLNRRADGAAGSYLYPLSWWRLPTPGWYITTDRWVLVVVVIITIVVIVYNHWQTPSTSKRSE